MAAIATANATAPLARRALSGHEARTSLIATPWLRLPSGAPSGPPRCSQPTTVRHIGRSSEARRATLRASVERALHAGERHDGVGRVGALVALAAAGARERLV